MKKLLLGLLVALSLAPLSWGQTVVSYAYQSPQTIFTTVTSGSGLRIIGLGAAFHQLSWNDQGTVATCQIQVDSSVDGVTWGNGDIIASTLCTSSGTATSTSHVVNFVRINITVISGAGVAVTALLTGYANNPAGGGGGITNGAGANVVTKSDGTNLVASSITDNGTTVAITEPISSSTGGTAFTHTQGTITTSNPTRSHTVTWNAGGVAFTNWLSNITCTAAATASIAAGFGTAGTQWQFKYGAANCASPQLLSPDGSLTNPAYGFSASATWGMFKLTSGGLDWNMFTVNGTSDVGISNARVQVPSNGGYYFSNSTTDASGSQTGAMTRSASGVIQFQGTTGGRTAFITSQNSVFVTANFTTSGVGTALENITGLTWTFPALATNWNFDCVLSYSQAVAAAAVAFGIKATTNNPTNIFANGIQQITAGPPATFTTGTLATLATQTATNIVSGTPGAQATNYTVRLGGTMELPASAVTINIMTSTATAGDTVTVLRGSYCALTP